MVRAILEAGVIHPLDELPEDWRDGRELIIREAADAPSPEDLDAWSRSVEALAGEIPPEDFVSVDAALAEADREAKAIVRRQMGLA